jgi:ribA/ribD-fused uncharacterized protein
LRGDETISMGVIAFRKVKEPFGWLSNLAPYPVPFAGQVWPTAEALFLALRFDDQGVRERIRTQGSPMAARFVARDKDLKPLLAVIPKTERDVANMRRVLRLKFTHYPKLRRCLVATHPHDIVEDCTRRGDTFWGARLKDGEWWGDNITGNLLMDLRDELREEDHERRA